MDKRYRNTGAPFRRVDGSVWGRGMVSVPTEVELARRAYKLRLEPTTLPTLPPPSDPDVWTLYMSAEQYIKLHPKGPHAPLARRVLEAKEVETEDSPEVAEEERADGDTNE
ncbi:hypothetical protein LCGC14_2468500 [marine sediment metagenome]|uniref:Uncharacterized protein n=1 Tax=marine sediment metagenome TaxID=412755 RepID=A0A0F9DN68_9ZZZZ